MTVVGEHFTYTFTNNVFIVINALSIIISNLLTSVIIVVHRLQYEGKRSL